jgi:hypothetical protein
MSSKRQARHKGEVKHVLLRGSRRNPVIMAAAPRKGRLTRLARFLKSHFPGSKVRVEKVKLGR